MASNIRVISKSMVQAEHHDDEQALNIDLTPWDLQFLLAEYIQRGLLYKIPEVPDIYDQDEAVGNIVVYLMKMFLASTLDYFPPLAGRLSTSEHEGNTVSFSVDCNNTGALFVHAVADEVTTSDIVKPSYTPSFVDSFFPLNGVKNYQGTSNPLLAVQVTELVDGFFICVSVNHSIVDGASFFHFFKSWLAIACDPTQLSKRPVLQREFFKDHIEFPIRLPRSCFDQQNQHEEFIPPPLKVRVFQFSKEKVAKLKEKANSEAGTKDISSLQALLSHLWRAVIRNRKIDDPNEETNYCLMVSGRPKLQKLPERYFGNVLQVGTTSMKVKDMLELGLGEVAWRMNKVVTGHDAEKFTDFLKSWTKTPKLKSMGNMVSNALVTSDSPRFNLYGGETGLGTPIAVRSGPANKFDGRLTVHCGVEEGSIEIEVCLAPQTFEAMEKDDEFMDTVTR
ncbi:Transferase [Corchorus olitorius]|uniref:Transferase n=1 Tax=Corchorus olitorius TaxID=93759 RepID=A0A1R3H7J9_9ROSI|nr:Transferase [Corchorus olitorius]